ncbi:MULTISPECIES: ATP-binding cassette domain-containing protein [Bacillus]|uniref:Multidrug ABC transporter ATP-binding protein n=2 Tax=Bacillus amyloliquefaciens group TaxID=1938374 RepID=A0AAI8N258_9BACI|nr:MULTISPECIES: ATP-binding cassette domain-containing protein [Bacillus]AME08595.1 multidrug ABC transporter ATP-binding protein [Bacillus sp. SDLI1]APA05038.1 multidrug ABC transporter ATP-binding protein [Bacillus velezensis]ASB67910.1 Fe(3+) ions import ATP-binding protein FbpC [Bacillus velezensis]AUJ79244.1 multidrug ABC transporter ATP-binding protein [Bacillus siamensis]AVB11927.1 multidrug ABC transporter ATP-binding protein [Bacillus velezensis]
MSEEYIKVESVNKVIKKNIVLKNINLSLKKGMIYGFRGPNGSGKTMLFRVLSGLVKPSEGKVIIDGKVLHKNISFPESIGILIEYPGFIPEYTGFANLKLLSMIQNKINDHEVSAVISRVGLDPNDKRKFRKYSLGMKQRLGIAQAIMENPELLILDEPTNALDEEAVKTVHQLLLSLKNEGKTILVASHDRETLQKISDIIYDIESGKIVKETMIDKEKKND